MTTSQFARLREQEEARLRLTSDLQDCADDLGNVHRRIAATLARDRETNERGEQLIEENAAKLAVCDAAIAALERGSWHTTLLYWLIIVASLLIFFAMYAYIKFGDWFLHFVVKGGALLLLLGLLTTRRMR